MNIRRCITFRGGHIVYKWTEQEGQGSMRAPHMASHYGHEAHLCGSLSIFSPGSLFTTSQVMIKPSYFFKDILELRIFRY